MRLVLANVGRIMEFPKIANVKNMRSTQISLPKRRRLELWPAQWAPGRT